MAAVTVNLYANLREYAGGAASVELEIEPGQTIEDVVRRIGIPTEQTKIIFVGNVNKKTSSKVILCFLR